MIELRNIFTPAYGVNLEYNKMIENKNGIPFVARTSQNNGIVGYVEEIKGLTANPAMTISLSASGSVMESFLQEEKYYSGRDLYYLKPKIKLTKNQLLYYCMVLRANKYRYSFGRQANKTLANIKIPSPSEIPNYVNKLQIQKPSKKPFLKNKLRLKDRKWKYFNLNKVFTLPIRGTRLVQELREIGKIPFVTAGNESSGVKQKIDSNMLKQKIFKNKITIDMFCNSYYHSGKFSCDDNILVIEPKKIISKYCLLFIVTIINMDSYKYQYGRQYRQKNFNKHSVKLPIDKNGDPDWQFMEDYIKSLPYSSNL